MQIITFKYEKITIFIFAFNLGLIQSIQNFEFSYKFKTFNLSVP